MLEVVMNRKYNCQNQFYWFLPSWNSAISQEPVDQLFTHNAVGISAQPVPVVLELHSCTVVANFLP